MLNFLGKTLLDKAYLKLTFKILKKIFFMFFGLIIVLYFLVNFFAENYNFLSKKNIIINTKLLDNISLKNNTNGLIIKEIEKSDIVTKYFNFIFYYFLKDNGKLKETKGIINIDDFYKYINSIVEGTNTNKKIIELYNNNTSFKNFILAYYNIFNKGKKLLNANIITSDYKIDKYKIIYRKYNLLKYKDTEIFYTLISKKKKIIFVKYLKIGNKVYKDFYIKFYRYKYKDNNGKKIIKTVYLKLNKKDLTQKINKK